MDIEDDEGKDVEEALGEGMDVEEEEGDGDALGDAAIPAVPPPSPKAYGS
jgi:hypothetical protein